MSSAKNISEALISSRNILFGGRSSEGVVESLRGVIRDIEAIEIESTKFIVERCVRAALLEIGGSRYLSAGTIINLIHNLPLDYSSEGGWDVDYFLSTELPGFLESYDSVRSSREITLYVCKIIGAKYSPS